MKTFVHNNFLIVNEAEIFEAYVINFNISTKIFQFVELADVKLHNFLPLPSPN